MDLIDRQAAIDAVRKLYILEPRINNDYAYDMALDQVDSVLKAIPSADIDLSGFSDKPWKMAYERGKAEAQRWIPVSERLPGFEENVLICDEDGDIYVGFLSGDLDGILTPMWIYDEYRLHTIDEVKAWQPLPEPYKE